MAGIVRATLGEGKLSDALTLAMKDDSEHPNDAILLDALGEVRFRRGEVLEAAKALNQSGILNPCLARTHYDKARYLTLSGMYASAQKELERAHLLAPADPEITRRWLQTHSIPTSPAQRLGQLKARLSDTSLSADDKSAVEATIKAIETQEKGSCELVTPFTEAKLEIAPIANGAGRSPQDLDEAALDVEFNGKKRRMEIDTGASGLLLSAAVAKSAGLVPELDTKVAGIGDSGQTGAFVTHVNDIKIGKLEFKNCLVRVLAHGGVLGVDGLIGPDVFRDYLVTLDIPAREVRLGPLPRRPDEAIQTTALVTSDTQAATSEADGAKDRYISPEMKDWTPVFRAYHFLIFPTSIGKAPVKLFVMDTGAQTGMISPDAAREVTRVGRDRDMTMKGISGEVNKVLIADDVKIAFGGVQQLIQGMTSFDTSSLTEDAGVEISGLIGFPTLRELVISIDYRDNLVKVVYDPKKGYHAR